MGETDPLWGGECFQSNASSRLIYHANVISVFAKEIFGILTMSLDSYQLEKYPGRSGNHNRMKIGFYWTAQVRNLPMKVFLSITTHPTFIHRPFRWTFALYKWS
jgi:hypothetical protein